MGKKTVRYLLPIIHFILSFVYERSFLIFNAEDGVRMAIPRSDFYSDKAEHMVAYIISKIFAALLIVLVWKLLFYVVDHFKDTAVKVGLCVFIVLFVVFGVFLLTDVNLRSDDNYITYAYALRLWPEYWHSAYLSTLYAGMMMVFPNPAAIGVLQWMGLSAVIGYAFNRIDKSHVLRGRLKWLLLLILVLPNSYILIVDPYRTEIYAIVCMFFASLLVMDFVDKKERNAAELALISVLAAFIAVFRSEGIILGLGGFVAALIFGYKPGFKRIFAHTAFAVLAFIVILLPQKMGDRKYYGKDYTIINSFPSLINILNDGNHNIDYDGAEESLAAINRVVPLDLISLYGMGGYHRYNIYCGRVDINQSYATDEEASAYVKGFYNLVFHNKKIYLKTQFVMWEQSLFLTQYPFVAESILTEPTSPIADFKLDLWGIGRAEYVKDLHLQSWHDNSFRQKVAGVISSALSKVHDFTFDKIHAASASLIIITLLAVIFMLKEFVLFFKKKRENTALGVFLLVLLLQYAAIVIVMPAGAQVYFHATYYGMLITEITYIAKLVADRKASKESL